MIISPNLPSIENLPARKTRASQSPSQPAAVESGITLSVNTDDLTAAVSPIQGVDEAGQTTENARNSILSQSAAAMLAQANSMPQSALRLLQQ